MEIVQMEAMAVARINGKMISWALRRSGASLDSLASKKLTLQKLAAWVSGEEFPSEGQAEDLADRLGIAYPMLFMPTVPPDEPIKIPDLRTLDGRSLRNPSSGLLEVLDSTRARQKWFREQMEEAGLDPLPFVGKFSLASDPSSVADDMRDALMIDALRTHESSDYEAFLKTLITRSESLGILVMRSAVVGHASRRPLSVKEFRGFAFPDDLAPVVFINDSDAKAAQIFTLAHEIAHVWIGAPGISGRAPNEEGNSLNTVERFCDSAAAEFLAPEREFRSLWKPSHPLDRNMFGASRHFNVSTLVALRRARDLRLLTLSEFFAKVNEQYDAYRRREREKLKKESQQKEGKKKSGNFWNSFEIRNGRTFNATVVKALREQRATYAEAGSLLGINPGAASRYMQRMSAG
jgi:Zn-dependent peptidase ImmA (M78 family)